MDSKGKDLRNPSMETTEEEAVLFSMQLITGYLLPIVLKSAIELNLFETMAKAAGTDGFVSPSQLATLLTTKNPEAHTMLDRILRLLASHSIVNCSLKTMADGSVERLYSLAPVSKVFMKNPDGASMAPALFLSREDVNLKSWYHLKDAILEGGTPFLKAYGMTIYEYANNHPRFNNLFNETMSNNSTITLKKVLEIYKGFEGVTSLVDVGGGTGATIHMIVSCHPKIKGINFDLPQVINNAPSYPGVDHVAGDMFVCVPTGEAFMLKWICHNWSDERCMKLLKNCYEALPENGKVIVIERVVPEAPDSGNATKAIFQLDLVMLAHCSGGKERTEKEYEALAKGAGFRQFHKVCCAYNSWVMEFTK